MKISVVNLTKVITVTVTYPVPTMVIAVPIMKRNVLEEIVKMTEMSDVKATVDPATLTKDVGAMNHVLHGVIVVSTIKKNVMTLVTVVTDVSIFAETITQTRLVIVIPHAHIMVIVVTTTKKNALVLVMDVLVTAEEATMMKVVTVILPVLTMVTVVIITKKNV